MTATINPEYQHAHGYFPRTVVVTEDVEAKVAINYAGGIAQTGEAVYGVTRTEALAGEAVCVDVEGEVILKTGDAIPAPGDLVEIQAGVGVPFASGFAFGRALEVATAADEYMRLHITREG